MQDGFLGRLQHAWNAFRNKDVNPYPSVYSSVYTGRPDRHRFRFGTDRSIVAPLYTRIAIDVAAVSIQHVRVNQNGNFIERINSGLNECLTTQANIDQTGRELIQDVVMTMFDEGCAAIVPVDTTLDPKTSNSFEINTLRVGKIIEWYPKHVKVDLYNDETGKYEEIVLSKNFVAIVDNPLYAIMNEPNSTLKRLVHKLNLLDAIDEQSGSGKLDLIIQLPYVIKSEARRKQAEDRRKDIEAQLANSKYGIAYTDGSERVTQLNRPAENNLMSQITYLTSMLYSQLGLSEKVFDGTADEGEMLNYYNRTVEPVLSAITENMNRVYLTKTARTQGQKIMFFREPFKLVPVNNLADIVDKFTRNEILSSNEVRGIIGYKPVDDDRANELRNKNINTSSEDKPIMVDGEAPNNKEEE